MKIKIRSTHRPCLVTTPKKTKTLIVGGTITHVNGEEWNHAYCAIMPGGAITLDDIEWEYASAPGGSAMQHPTEVTRVPKKYVMHSDSDRNKMYEVTEHGDGRWSCSCDSYKYGRGKHCKHIVRAI